MATAEEILETMELEGEDGVCRIDVDSREIAIPESLKLVGVESDDDVTRRQFEMASRYGEVNLSEFDVRINYRNANNEDDVYLVEDKRSDDEKMTFSWLIGRSALRHKGKIRFVVCLYKLVNGEKEQEWNTTLGEFVVLEGLEPDAEITQDPDYDIVTQILNIANGSANRAAEAAKRAEEAAKRAEAAGGTGGSGGANINDTTPSATTTYSSKKIEEKLTQLNQAVEQEATERQNTFDTLNKNKLDASALPAAVNSALAQAKESGEFDGVGIKSIDITEV